MSRALAPVLVVVLALGALTAAVASAVRAGGGSARGATGTVAAMPEPAAGATGPTAAAGIGATGTTGATGVGRARPARPKPATALPATVSIPVPSSPSRALGHPWRGSLANGVLLPAEGADHTTWDAILQVSPNRDWRRVGTDRLVSTILTVAAGYRRAHPGAPRLVVQDLSLPEGGHFGREYGGLGHASHQNGLDVDIAYPRRDRREVGIDRVADVDRPLAQALVTAFVRAGAQFVFVGPRTGLRGPRKVVQRIPAHDDHLHVRILPR